MRASFYDNVVKPVEAISQFEQPAIQKSMLRVNPSSLLVFVGCHVLLYL